MTNRILCHEREMLLKLNFFQLMKQYRSRGSVLISIYRLDALDLIKTEMRMRQNDKKCLRSSMNSALVLQYTVPSLTWMPQLKEWSISHFENLCDITAYFVRQSYNAYIVLSLLENMHESKWIAIKMLACMSRSVMISHLFSRDAYYLSKVLHSYRVFMLFCMYI